MGPTLFKAFRFPPVFPALGLTADRLRRKRKVNREKQLIFWRGGSKANRKGPGRENKNWGELAWTGLWLAVSGVSTIAIRLRPQVWWVLKLESQIKASAKD
jgi:hypothetical protein